MATMEEELGFKPIHTTWTMKKSPFPIAADAKYMYCIIKERLAREVLQCDFGRRFNTYCQWLHRYISLFGYCFPKEDHRLFIQLLYRLVLDKTRQQKDSLEIVGRLLTSLVKKKKYIPHSGEFVLDWKPLFDQWLYLRASDDYAVHSIAGVDAKTVLDFVRNFKLFFGVDAVPQILQAIRQFKCRGKTQSPFPRHYLYPTSFVFLPTLVPAGTFDRTVGLWINEVIDEFMEEDDTDALVEFGSAISDATFYNCGRVDLDRCMSRIITLELAQWKVPFDLFDFDRNVIIRCKYKPSDIWVSGIGRLLIYSITPKSNTLDLLEKIVPALAFVTDPSVFTVNNKAVRHFLSDMVVYLKRRLTQERLDNASFTKWSEVTPADCRLTDELVARIVNLLLPPLETMLFGKMYAEGAASLISYLSIIRADLVVPRVTDLVKGEFSRLTEPHRVFIALKVSNCIVQGVLNVSAISPPAPDLRAWILDMLPVAMGFISVNDDKKSSEAVTFLFTVVNRIPMIACRHAMKHSDTLCKRSQELEDFLITYTETLLNYAQESIDTEAGQAPSVQRMVSELHHLLTVALYMAPSSLRRRAASLVLSSLEGGRFPWNTTPNEWSHLMKPFVVLEPEHCLPRIVKVAKQLMRELEEDYELDGKDKYPSSIPESQVNELVSFVSMIFFAQPVHYRQYHATIEKLFGNVFKFAGSQAIESLSHLVEAFHRSFSFRLRVKDPLESIVEGGNTSSDTTTPCYVKHWGLVVHTDSWQPRVEEKPTSADFAFRDTLNTQLVRRLIATILRVTAKPAAETSNDERMDLRQAMTLLAGVSDSVAHATLLCAPVDRRLGRDESVPEKILTERLLPAGDLPELMVDGERFWDLLLDTMHKVIDWQFEDFETWGALCELVTTLVTGDSHGCVFRDFKSGNKMLLMLTGQEKPFQAGEQKRRDVWLRRKHRFLYDLQISMKKFVMDIHACVWMVSSLSPRRWSLLQRFMFFPAPSKDAWPYLCMTTMRCFNAYPETAELFLPALAAYTDSLSDEDVKNLGQIPITRVICIARYLTRTSAYAPVMREFVKLVSRSQETRLAGNGETKELSGAASTSLSLDWLEDAPLLDEVARELRQSEPTLNRPAFGCDESPEEIRTNRVQEGEQFLNEVGEVLDTAKEQLLRSLLRTVQSFVAGNAGGRARFPAPLAETLLRLLRTSLNPGVQYSLQDIVRDLAHSEAPGSGLRTTAVRAEQLPGLCAWPDGRRRCDDPPPLLPVALCSSEAETRGFVFAEAATDGDSPAVALFRERLGDAEFVAELMDTYLQLQRTARMTSSKHMFAYGLMRSLAPMLGSSLLTDALQTRLLALLEVDETPELVTVCSVIAGLIINCGSWQRREHDALCRWLVPVLESGVARGRFSPTSVSESRNPLSVLSSGYLGDPRRLNGLWDFLTARLQRAQPTLDDRETEQLVFLTITLLEGFRTWRVLPLVERLDALMRPLLADSVLSLRHSPLVNRWLLLSMLSPDDLQLKLLFGAERVLAPTRWLTSLFTPEKRAADDKPLPDWILRLGYLCPGGKVDRQYGFGALLMQHLDLVLLARGNNAQVNDETTREAVSSLPGLSLVVLRRGGLQEPVMTILDKLQTVLEKDEASDRSVCAALSLWRQTLCRNIVFLTDEVIATTYDIICRCLRHEALPVVRATSQAASELLRRGILLPKLLLSRLNTEDLAPSAMAYGLSALMEAFPHRLFDELEEVLDEMKLLLKRDCYQRTVVEKAVRSFMRTHQDAWNERWRAELSDSSLDSLRDLCGSGSYFS